MKKKLLVSSLLVLILSLCLCAFSLGEEQDMLDQILASGVLRIGTEGTYMPNSYHDEDGNLVGFDVEVASKIAEKLGVRAEFMEAEWDSLFAALDAGRVDLVINEVEYSDERALKYDFSQPYTYIRGALMVAEDNTDIQSFADLAGKRSAQNLTSSWGQLAESYGAQVVSVDSMTQCVELLRTGRADATLNAETAFYSYLSQHPDSGLKIVAYTDSTSSSVVPVPKGNPRLLAAINDALTEMKASGELAEISNRYFGQDITQPATQEEEAMISQMNVTVNNVSFTATLESNQAAQALVDMMRNGPLTLSMQDYAGFEKVGPLGASLPASDVQTTTQSGDIVLYNGNQIVIFYGSNSWSYTRLGHIDDLTGWADALGSGDVSVTFSLAE